jgi:hypothetical protein
VRPPVSACYSTWEEDKGEMEVDAAHRIVP